MATTTTTTTTPLPTQITETVLVGTSNGTIATLEYSTNGASVVFSQNLDSPVASVMFAEETNKAYIATNSNLYSYSICYYANVASDANTASNAASNNSSHDITQLLALPNNVGSIISTYTKSNDSLWAIQSYNGKVDRISPSDLGMIQEYGEFDAPFKVRFSAFHNAYFVAGSNILWKIDLVTSVASSVYQVNEYNIKDFDVSESGVICLLLNGLTNDIIRIIKNDLYTFALNRPMEVGTLAFCKYCKEGRFYILVELNTGSYTYSAVHYIFDSVANTLDSISAQSSLSVTTTTTTPGATTKAVQVTYPVGGESIQIGQQYDIHWISSKGLTDSVKIELYKADVLYDTLSANTSNTGIFSWNIASSIESGSDYKIKITWLSASSDPNNYDMSAGAFSILQSVVTTTTTTTTRVTQYAIGIDYSPASDQILIVLASGLYMIFELATMTSYGLLALGISDPSAMATRSMVIRGEGSRSKVRIFVGSEMYLSDRWDSGIIETDLKSMFYGGGNNLAPGGKYWVHIQTYSAKEGWSDLDIREFVMPR